MKTCTKFFVTICLVATFAKPCFGNCSNSEKAEFVNYLPTLMTGPASLALSGIGFIVDGTIYLTGNLLTMGVICAVPTLGAASIDDHFAGQVLNACGEVVMQSVDLGVFDTDLGPHAFAETQKWRCPMFVNEERP
jgi:hypothetical protein